MSVILRSMAAVLPYRCLYCGAPSAVDPADQRQPPDYCHPGDHEAEETDR